MATKVDDVKAAFNAYNPTNVRIVRESDRDYQKGYAFVTFATEDDQTRAVTDHRESGIALRGGTALVRFAQPQSNSPARVDRSARHATEQQKIRQRGRNARVEEADASERLRHPRRSKGSSLLYFKDVLPM
jgi:RNA recognition motif-containing protein